MPEKNEPPHLAMKVPITGALPLRDVMRLRAMAADRQMTLSQFVGDALRKTYLEPRDEDA